MKVLLLASKPFLPVVDGGNEASRILVKELLAIGIGIDLLTFSSEKHPYKPLLFQTDEWKGLHVEDVPILLKTNPFAAFTALAKGKSYNLSRFTSPLWLEKLRSKSHNTYDFILIDSLYASEEIERIKTLFPDNKIIYRAHNVESQLWKEKTAQSSSFLKRKYLTILQKQLEIREKQIIDQCDVILPISEMDQELISHWTTNEIALLPYFPETKTEENRFVSPDFFFLGAMNWSPNVEAHEILVKNILPKLFKILPQNTMRFAGSFQDQIIQFKLPNVQYCGFTDDKDVFLKESGILLAPIESGSGVRIKLIEAMNLGVPIVTTEKGAQGMDVQHGDGIFIAKNNEEFIQYAVELSKNKAFRLESALKAKESFRNWKLKHEVKSIFEKYVG